MNCLTMCRLFHLASKSSLTVPWKNMTDDITYISISIVFIIVSSSSSIIINHHQSSSIIIIINHQSSIINHHQSSSSSSSSSLYLSFYHHQSSQLVYRCLMASSAQTGYIVPQQYEVCHVGPGDKIKHIKQVCAAEMAVRYAAQVHVCHCNSLGGAT